MVLSVFIGVVFLVFLLSSVRLPFFLPVFFSLFLNFRLFGHVGLGSYSFVALFVLPFRSLVMRVSIGLRIEGRSAEESVSG